MEAAELALNDPKLSLFERYLKSRKLQRVEVFSNEFDFQKLIARYPWLTDVSTYIRLGKTGSLGPWSRVMACYSKPSFSQNDPPPRSQRSRFAKPNLGISNF